MQDRQDSAETIIVRLPNWVGDAVMATPALRALRNAHPSARIHAVARPAVCALLSGLATVDVFHPYDHRGRHQGVAGLWRLARELRQHSAQVGLVLPHSFSSAFVFWLARIPRRVGYRTPERWFLLKGPKPPSQGRRRLPEPMTRHYLRLVQALGIEGGSERLDLAVSAAEEDEAGRHLQELGLVPGEPYAAINPGASFGASKLWTLEGFAQTVQGLHARMGLRSLVLCGPGEESLAHDIALEAGDAAVDTSRKMVPLPVLKPVLRDARVLVTTDTGPRHIATAFQVPTVVVMGPTDPRYTASNLERTRVLRREVDCGPCHLKVCPLDHRCMTGIHVDQVLDAVTELLGGTVADPQEASHA